MDQQALSADAVSKVYIPMLFSGLVLVRLLGAQSYTTGSDIKCHGVGMKHGATLCQKTGFSCTPIIHQQKLHRLGKR